jgi:hypothetical protein
VLVVISFLPRGRVQRVVRFCRYVYKVITTFPERVLLPDTGQFQGPDLDNVRGGRIWYRRRISLASPCCAGLLLPSLNVHAEHE